MEILIVTAPVPIETVRELAQLTYRDMIKGVADIERSIIALGGEYHIDANNRLIEEGSKQPHLWGFNIHFDREGDDWIEFRSLINIRPAAGSRSMMVRDEALQGKMRDIIESLILKP